MSAADPTLGRDPSTGDSSHWGFVDSIKAIRLARAQALICFSRSIALRTLFEAFEPGEVALRRKTGSQFSAWVHELVAECCLSFPSKFPLKHWP